jgi:hypothetical protein
VDDAKTPPNGSVETLCEHYGDEPVKIAGRDGVTKDYIITEMSEADQARWQKYVANNGVKTLADGSRVRTSFEGLQPELISICLRDEAGNKVPKDVIAGWGARCLNRLFVKCRLHNGLDGEGEVKKD